MGKLELSNKIKGDIGEILFEHYSKKHNYAYISTEEIYKTLTPRNVLVFRYGYERIPITIPDEIVEEVRRLCKPSNRDEREPSFTIDYLTVSLHYCFDYMDGKHIQKHPITVKGLTWCEIKTGKSRPTKNQKALIGNTKIPLSFFRIKYELPDNIEVGYDEKDFD